MSPTEYEVINKVVYPRFKHTVRFPHSLIRPSHCFALYLLATFAIFHSPAVADMRLRTRRIWPTSKQLRTNCLPSTGGRAVRCSMPRRLWNVSPQSLISSISLLIQFSVFVLPINCIYIWNRQDWRAGGEESNFGRLYRLNTNRRSLYSRIMATGGVRSISVGYISTLFIVPGPFSIGWFYTVSNIDRVTQSSTVVGVQTYYVVV